MATYAKGRIYKIETAALQQKIDLLHDELVNLPWQDWTEDDRADLVNRLRDMHGGTEAILEAMGASFDNEEEEPEDEGRENVS